MLIFVCHLFSALGDPSERLRKQRQAIEVLSRDVQRLENEIESNENKKFEARARFGRCEEELQNVRLAKQDAELKKSTSGCSPCK